MNTEKPEVTVIDAVMGTGKSSWVIEQVIQNPQEKYVIVVPLLPEVERYEEALAPHRAVYAPHVDGHSPDIDSKLKAFKRAIQEGAGVIITTHALFSLWDPECIKSISKQGCYTLILDETVELVQEAEIKKHDYQLLLNSGYIKEVPYDDGKGNFKAIESTPKTAEYDGKLNDFIKQAQCRNIISIDDSKYIQTIKPENITAFKESFILTYMYPGSQMDCWFKLYGLEVSLKTLIRADGTDELTLMEHTGDYSGEQFRGLIKLVDSSGMNLIGARGRKKRIPLSTGAFKKMNQAELKKLQAHLANIARHLTIKFMKATMGDDTTHPGYYFMWTTKKAYRAILEERLPYKRVPVSAPLGFPEDHLERDTDRECFVAHNQRATNNYSHKAVLAYLTTPLPRVPIKNFFTGVNLNFDDQTYMLSTLLQWVWRSRIRNGETILLWIPSEPLRELFQRWLCGTMWYEI